MKRMFLLLFVAAAFMTACNDSGSSPEVKADKKDSTSAPAETKQERNKKIAIASTEQGILGHNAEATLKDAAADYTDYGDGSMAPVKGADSSKKMLAEWMHAFPDFHGENIIYAADGDYVFIYGTWMGTFKNDMFGIKATGKSYKLADVDILKFNDEGKLIEHRSILPGMEVLKAVGAKLPPPPPPAKK